MVKKDKVQYWASNHVVKIAAILIAIAVLLLIFFGFNVLDSAEEIQIEPLEP